MLFGQTIMGQHKSLGKTETPGQDWKKPTLQSRATHPQAWNKVQIVWTQTSQEYLNTMVLEMTHS